jgi:hypothetical protein
MTYIIKFFSTFFAKSRLIHNLTAAVKLGLSHFVE